VADVPTKLTVTKGNLVQPQPAFQGKRSYVKRLIEVAVSLAPDQKTNQPIKFAGTDSNTVTLSGFRTKVRVENSGAPAGSHATIAIYGLTPSTMNQLSTLGMIFNSIQRNTVTVSAGDEESGLSPVFGGTIAFAFPEYNQAPDVPFNFECQTGYIDGIVPVPASSFSSPTDVATIMAGFANQMNIGFENNGVTVQMPPCYFPGTVMEQVRRCAQAAHINAERVDGDTKLAIWPLGGSRTSISGAGPLPLISADTGMIGYPSFAPNGYMIVRTLFDPKIAFGGTVQVKSSIPQANRTWVVQKLDLALDSLVPKGNWMATLYCYPLGFAAPPPPGGS
jgi:hypothetical protein